MNIESKLFDRLTYLHGRDNFTERVVHSFTIWILLFFTLLLSSNLLFGSLITCQAPAESPDTWVSYYEDYCYYQDKYRHVGNKNPRPSNLPPVASSDESWVEDERITYYQWIPYVLITQMFMCLVPAVMWKFIGLRYFHGCDFDAVLRSFIFKMPEGTQKMETVKWISDENWKKMAKDTYRLLKFKKEDRFGMHSTMILYVFMKWISFISLFSQFLIMSNMYAGGKLLWGVHSTYNLMYGAFDDIHSGLFPWVVKCNVHRFDVGASVAEQSLFCLLGQNFLNEKAFLFLYWWYVFTVMISFFSALRFSVLLLVPSYQRYATKSILPTQEYFLETAGKGNSLKTAQNELLEYFIDYCGCDGYLLFQLVGDMTHMVFVRQLARELWRLVIVKNDSDEEDDDEEDETKDPTAPPLDDEDGQGDFRQKGGKDKSQPKLNQLQKEMNELKRRFALLDTADDNEKNPLLHSGPSSSTGTTSPISQNSPSDEIEKYFEENEEAKSSDMI